MNSLITKDTVYNYFVPYLYSMLEEKIFMQCVNLDLGEVLGNCASDIQEQLIADIFGY